MGSLHAEKEDFDEKIEDGNVDFVKRTKSGLKLEPQPSDDPEGIQRVSFCSRNATLTHRIDPLNWSISKKIRTLIILSFASFTGIAQATANQGGFVIQGELYHKTPTQVANSVSAAVSILLYIIPRPTDETQAD